MRGKRNLFIYIYGMLVNEIPRGTSLVLYTIIYDPYSGNPLSHRGF